MPDQKVMPDCARRFPLLRIPECICDAGRNRCLLSYDMMQIHEKGKTNDRFYTSTMTLENGTSSQLSFVFH